MLSIIKRHCVVTGATLVETIGIVNELAYWHLCRSAMSEVDKDTIVLCKLQVNGRTVEMQCYSVLD